MSYYHFVWKAILLLIMAIAILRTLDAGQNGYLNLASRILTVVLVVVFTVLERGFCLMVGGSNTAVSVCAPIFRALAPGIGSASRTNPLDYETSAENGWLHCGPAGAGHFVKMVHNGVEYGIMQATPKDLISCMVMLGASTLPKAMLKLLQWIIQETINMILMLLR